MPNDNQYTISLKVEILLIVIINIAPGFLDSKLSTCTQLRQKEKTDTHTTEQLPEAEKVNLVVGNFFEDCRAQTNSDFLYSNIW